MSLLSKVKAVVSPAEATARQLVADLAGITKRSRDSIMSRYQAMEDRVLQAARDLEPAEPEPSCNCGEASCARGVCR